MKQPKTHCDKSTASCVQCRLGFSQRSCALLRQASSISTLPSPALPSESSLLPAAGRAAGAAGPATVDKWLAHQTLQVARQATSPSPSPSLLPEPLTSPAALPLPPCSAAALSSPPSASISSLPASLPSHRRALTAVAALLFQHEGQVGKFIETLGYSDSGARPLQESLSLHKSLQDSSLSPPFTALHCAGACIQLPDDIRCQHSRSCP